MSERRMCVDAPDGAIETFVALPEREGAAAPCVVVAPDNSGSREAIHDLARGLAHRGFAACVPDLYYRTPLPGVRPPLSREDHLRIEPVRRALTIDHFAADAEVLVAALDREPGLDASRPCFVGTCIGSGYALAAAFRLGDRIPGIVVLDGCELGDRAGTPYPPGACPAASVLALCPERGERVFAGALAALLVERGAQHRLEDCPDVRHGFCLPDWPGGVFDAADRDRALDRTAAFLAESLRG